ncbi:MAG TPA: substrate-binding domain-containing protein [Anaerolineae bacterium]|nr:substrate-binding domain-containing protein [Anaerolineae bacterium]
MTTFERRQQILRLVRDQSASKVTELARLLGVSEGTIRNDLRALEGEGQLTRVRGGAVLTNIHRFASSSFAERAQVNIVAKQRIACRAADMVEDGDSVLLDSSTTVFHIAPYLQDRSHLTIITNGIEVAFAMAQNPTHTVILMGGILRPEQSMLVGHLGERALDKLYIKTAFVSCSGFSVEAGLTQVDIQEAQLKSRMMESAERIVALIDSTKFGEVLLTPFASVEQVSHILTDSGLDPRYIEQLRQTCVVLTVCGESTTSSYTPCSEESPRYKIGFASLGESMSFPVDVRRGLEQAAQNASNVDLILADNQLNAVVALQVADHLIAEGADLVIEYQIDEEAGGLIMDKFKEADVPVIAVDIPMVGATYFGVNHYRAGRMAGVALGNWIAEHWGGTFDRLLVLEEQRSGALVATRIQGQLDGVQSVVGEVASDRIIRLDSGNTRSISRSNMRRALDSLPNEHRLAVISFNDDAAMGAVSAATAAGREQDVVIVGQGADRVARREIRQPGSRLIGSSAYWPERYGQKLIDVAQQILRGDPVPPAVYNEHVFITKDNIDEFYPVSGTTEGV